jgi:hypothetical protein
MIINYKISRRFLINSFLSAIAFSFVHSKFISLLNFKSDFTEYLRNIILPFDYNFKVNFKSLEKFTKNIHDKASDEINSYIICSINKDVIDNNIIVINNYLFTETELLLFYIKKNALRFR